MRRVLNFICKNSAKILTGLGVIGVVITVATTVDETAKAVRTIDAEEMDPKEKKRVITKAAVKPVISGATTIACIIGSNVVSSKKEASLLNAYALLSNSYGMYRDSTKEIFGEDADKSIRQHVACKGYDHRPNKDEQLYYDFHSSRYFWSTPLKIVTAESKINEELATHMSANPNDFYRSLGLKTNPAYNRCGWSVQDYDWIKIIKEQVDGNDAVCHGLEKGRDCIMIMFDIDPYPEYLL